MCATITAFNKYLTNSFYRTFLHALTHGLCCSCSCNLTPVSALCISWPVSMLLWLLLFVFIWVSKYSYSLLPGKYNTCSFCTIWLIVMETKGMWWRQHELHYKWGFRWARNQGNAVTRLKQERYGHSCLYSYWFLYHQFPVKIQACCSTFQSAADCIAQRQL